MNKFQKVASKLSIEECRRYAHRKDINKLYKDIKSSYLIIFKDNNFDIKTALDYKNKYKEFNKNKWG